MTNVRDLNRVDWESGPDRKLTHNTYRSTWDGQPCVIFHRTTIIVRLPGGGYKLSSGGWQTTTTKQRLNALLPGGYSISQKDFRWTVHTPEGDLPFFDHMIVGQ